MMIESENYFDTDSQASSANRSTIKENISDDTKKQLSLNLRIQTQQANNRLANKNTLVTGV
jgi:hypothetical protein